VSTDHDELIRRILDQRRRIEELELDLVSWRADYRRLILDANRAGLSQRALARALDVTYQRVQEMLRYAQEEEKRGWPPERARDRR
jgi:alkylation response protein AidB-like acyl-CoA dehydrogenase